MRVHVITYFCEDGEAGVTAIYRSRRKAESHFKQLVRGCWEGDDKSKKEIEAEVKKAIKAGFYEYPGSGCGPQPWYDLAVEEVQ
jgi:hypothetical protein